MLTINPSSFITLTQNAVFAPECTGGAQGSYNAGEGDPSSVADLRDPFYASTSPQIYAIAAATVVSYLLVIMLFITPRTFFVGGPGGGAGFLGRRGIITGSYSSSSIVGVGRRPWLQKVAALTVAISLTIATADTFKVAKRQYEIGYMDANALTDEVVGGLEIRIVRVISTTFLWLAQVQTLIRLFPRHKEKVIIKWTGFALIVLDTIFSILNSFVYTSGRTRPRTFVDAVPALSYLFELSLSLLYAAWVIYYSLCKRRFAFFHPKMRNICLVALLSLSAVLVPVVFFVLDIAQPYVAGWGDYIRWVGAAAASVVVWEWVERIEALERDERKDGILGREIFDGDEMLEVTPSAEIDWPRHPRYRPGGSGGPVGMVSGWDGGSGMNGDIHRPTRSRPGFQQRHIHTSRSMAPDPRAMASGALPATSQHAQNIPPPATATPISRADTTSADSTLYAVQHHQIAGPSPPIPEEIQVQEPTDLSESSEPPSTGKPDDETKEEESSSNLVRAPLPQTAPHGEILRWIAANNPFTRRRASPPPEVAIAQAGDRGPPRPSQKKEVDRNERWNVKSKLENFAASQREKMKSRNEGRITETSLPVTVIPAQPRGQRTWSPQYYEDQMSQQGNSEQTAGSSDRQEQNQSPDYDPHYTHAAPANPHYVPLPPQPRPGYGDRYSPNSSNGRLLSRRGILTFADEERGMMTSPPSTASPVYRYSQYSTPTHTELAPIYSIPSSELSVQPPVEYTPVTYSSSRNGQSSSHARAHTTETNGSAATSTKPRQSSTNIGPHHQDAPAAPEPGRQTSSADRPAGSPSVHTNAHPPGETNPSESDMETRNSSPPIAAPATELETLRPDGLKGGPPKSHRGTESPTAAADAPNSATANGSENSQQDQDKGASHSNSNQPVSDVGNDNTERADDVP